MHDCYVDMFIAGKMILGAYLHNQENDKTLAPVVSELDMILRTEQVHSTHLRKNMLRVFNTACQRREFLSDDFLHCVKLMALVMLRHYSDIGFDCLNWLPKGQQAKLMLENFDNVKCQIAK